MEIAQLLDESHATAVEHGWWDDEMPRSFGDCLALTHSELSEALEEFRNGKEFEHIYFSGNGKPEGIAAELADAMIRIADICKHFDIPLERALMLKLAYNKKRPYRHGDKRL